MQSPVLAGVLTLASIAGAAAPAPSPNAGDAGRVMALARFEAGRDALAAKRWTDAEAEFLAAIRLHSALALAHYGLGQALTGQARHPEAADAFLSCRNVFGLASRSGAARARETEIRDLRDTLKALASRHALSGDRFLEMQLEKRLAELQKWAGPPVAWAPPGVTIALGTAYFQAGALEEAEREFLSVLRDDPGSGDAENNLAVVYLATGRLEQAEAAAQRAEKAGVRVSPQLKDEIRQRRASPLPP